MFPMEVEVRSIALREQKTKKGDLLYWQKVGFQNGGDFPTVFDLFRPDGKPLPLGKHKVDLVLRTNQWDALQVDSFKTLEVK